MYNIGVKIDYVQDNLIIFLLNQNTMQTTGGLNCFSVGLASGFIEPLESTGLALLINGIYGLKCFEKGNYTEQDRLEYNSNMKQVYEDSMNFVALHYFNNP